MKTIETSNRGGGQAIVEGELHQHTCHYCEQDFGCEGEHCNPSDTQLCAECEE